MLPPPLTANQKSLYTKIEKIASKLSRLIWENRIDFNGLAGNLGISNQGLMDLLLKSLDVDQQSLETAEKWCEKIENWSKNKNLMPQSSTSAKKSSILIDFRDIGREPRARRASISNTRDALNVAQSESATYFSGTDSRVEKSLIGQVSPKRRKTVAGTNNIAESNNRAAQSESMRNQNHMVQKDREVIEYSSDSSTQTLIMTSPPQRHLLSREECDLLKIDDLISAVDTDGIWHTVKVVDRKNRHIQLLFTTSLPKKEELRFWVDTTNGSSFIRPIEKKSHPNFNPQKS